MQHRMNRREWLSTASLIALAPSVPLFLRRATCAAEPDQKGKILVAIQLDGGNDGINTVVPYADDGYAKARRELRLPTDRLVKLNDQIALHPSLRPAADLMEDGRLAIVQGVGYPNPNRSHDVSMAIWHTGRMDEADHASFGWIGRAMDSRHPVPTPSAPLIFVGENTPPRAIRGRKSTCLAMNRLTDMQRSRGTASIETANAQLPNSQPGPSENTPSGDELVAFVERSSLDAYATADLLESIVSQSNHNSAGYPASELSRRLQMIAQLIKADMPSSVYYAVQSGYDTHSGQLPVHARLLGELAGSLKAFLNDLKAASLEDRVLVMCFSEFGRRVDENASLGTDHGTAGPVILAGSGIKPGLHGATPSLVDLDEGDLKMGIDFRRVYATVLEQWLNVPTNTVLEGEFEPLPLFA